MPFPKHNSFKTIPKSTSRQICNQQQHHYKPFNTFTKQSLKMPLIDPVTTSAGGDKTTEWQNKLVGKKLGDASNEIVCYVLPLRLLSTGTG